MERNEESDAIFENRKSEKNRKQNGNEKPGAERIYLVDRIRKMDV